MMKSLKMKTMAAVLAVLCCGGVITQYPHQGAYAETTIAELEAKKEANNKKIAEYEAQLAQYAESQKEEDAYQEALQEKIDVLQENMGILDSELEGIKENLFNLERDIAKMEDTIAQQETDIDEGLEEFKLRLRAMYVNGSDSLASALVGATDFYDLLSKYELISCVARHDDELVNNLRDELESYNQNLLTLEGQKTEQEQAQADAEAKQEEMRVSMESLNEAYADSQAEKERLEAEKERTNKSIDELEAENEQAERDEQEIRDQIARAEEARKKAEQEAAEKAAREEEERRQRETAAPSYEEGDNNEDNGDDEDDEPSYSEPSYSDSSFTWPCPSCYYVTSYYGYRWGTLHKGIDIGASAGASITASRSGTVIACNTSCVHNYGKSSNCCGNGYGNYVIISHDGTYSTLYGHMTSVYVSVGDYVSQGDTIGTVGTTGYSTGNHLHFEVREYGSPVNPSGYLNY